MMQIIEDNNSRCPPPVNDLGGLRVLGRTASRGRSGAVVNGSKAGRRRPRAVRRYGVQVLTQFTSGFLVDAERGYYSTLVH